MVTMFSPTSGTSGRLQTVHLCHLDSYTVTVCNGYSIAFDERVTFWLQRAGSPGPGHCLMRVRLLHCMRVRLRNGYTQAYAQIMQHTHMHKALTGCVEAKKLLPHQRQSNYRRQIST